MVRGTTPTHIFTLPFSTSLVKEVMVIYAQNDVEVFHKDTYDCNLEGNEITVTLTQEDTLQLNHHHTVQVQVRVLTTDDTALASTVKVISVEKCLNDEVL